MDLIMQQYLDEVSKVTISKPNNNGKSFDIEQFAKKHYNT
jgi:hypothetical protein